jgi:hypothetical protein
MFSPIVVLAFAFAAAISTGQAGDISQETNWFLRASPVTNTLWGVAYGGGRFVAVGDRGTVIISEAGGVWESNASGFGGNLYCVRYVNGVFMAGTTNGLLVSTNGEHWVYRRIAVPSFAAGTVSHCTDIAYGGGQHVVAAKADSGAGDRDNLALLTSFDGINWTQRYGAYQGAWHGNVYPGDPRFKSGLAFGNGRCVEAGWATSFKLPGERRLVTSTDLVNWTPSSPDYTALSFEKQFHTVTHSGGQFVAAGWYLGAYFISSIVTSPDGFNWTVRMDNEPFTVINEVTSGAGWLVAIGDNVRVSTNGFQWAGPQTPYLWTQLYGITYGAGTFVAVGYRGTIRQSDVVQDTAPFFVTAPTNLVVVRENTAIFRSQAAGSGPLAYQWFKDGSLLAGKTAPTLTITNVQLSDAGTYTVTITSPFGSITSAPVTLAVSFVTIHNYAGLTIKGIPGHTYRIDYLNQFQSGTNWQTLTNLVLPATPHIWIDYESPAAAKRYYRVAELP